MGDVRVLADLHEAMVEGRYATAYLLPSEFLDLLQRCGRYRREYLAQWRGTYWKVVTGDTLFRVPGAVRVDAARARGIATAIVLGDRVGTRLASKRWRALLNQGQARRVEAREELPTR